MKRTLFFVAAFALAVGAAFAQQVAVSAEVEYSLGDDIVVIRDGKSLPFEDVMDLRLMEGDQIQTGKRTFLELRVQPSGSLVKIAENTAFVLESLSAPSESGFRLLYGRVRAKVNKLASSASFNIKSDSVVAGVRGTDFGYDVIVPKTSEAQKPVTRVYCFDGSVVVTVTQPESERSVEITVKTGSMVQVKQEDGEMVPEQTKLTEEVRSFWEQNDFSSSAGASPTLTLPAYASVRAGLKVKNSAIFGGIILVGLGSVLQGVGAYAYASGDSMLGLNAVAGGAFMGILALPVLVFGLTSNPALAEP